MTMQDCFTIDKIKMRKGMTILFGMFVALVFLLGCDSASQYRRLVQNQLESGVQNDTIFHGVHFGMTSDEYYDHISKLGHQGIVSQGGDMSVLYEIKDFDTPIDMNFVAEYINDSIQEMRIKYSYSSWAPWNDRTTDERLWKDVMKLYKDQYGKDFIKVKSDRSIRPALVWVKGNQRISLFQNQENRVDGRITNLNKITEQRNRL